MTPPSIIPQARRARPLAWRILAACALAFLSFEAPTNAREDDEAAPTQRPEDILANIVVAPSATGTTGRVLPKIAVFPTLASNLEDVTLRNVVRRDLELCGEFEVLTDSAAPEGLYLSDTPVDVDAWKKVGAEAIVKIAGKPLANGNVELTGAAYLVDSGSAPVFEDRLEVAADQVRVESHRVADKLIGALTGTDGGFSSQMAFVFGHGKARRAYVIDSDGHDPHAVSPPDQLALSPAFGPNHELYWSASVGKGRFRLFRGGQAAPIALAPGGSVYGVAFSRNADKVALSIAVGATIKVFQGPDLEHLSEASKVELALHPAWSPNDKLAFAGAGKWAQRVFVGDKPISPAGLHASAPVFCRHPDGVRAVYAVGAGKTTDLVATGETGGGTVRLTASQGSNGYPACSPDGRLIAFFSTRTSGEGPGLYVMRLDGSRPRRVSPLLGDSLRWARLPAGRVARLPDAN